MKQHFERYWVYYLIGVVFLVGVLVCVAAYRPAVGSGISDKNADWGNFGAFFWGFGTMCFTLLNVIVFYLLQQSIYRKQIYDTYRNVLNELVEKFMVLKVNKGMVKFDLNTKKCIISMNGVLGCVSESNAYSKKVGEFAADLLNRSSQFVQYADYDTYAELLGDLSGFQVCLLNNKVSITQEIVNDSKEINK